MSYDISIVIPTYNEKPRIGATLEALAKYIKDKKLNAEVLIIDSDSPDGTIEEAKKMSSKFSHLSVINAGPKPKGKFVKGKQVKKGMLRASGKYVIFMDADLATPLKYIDTAVKQLESGSQVSICVRNLNASHKGLRRIISGAGNVLVQAVLLPGINDTQCGFKAFTAEAVKNIFPLQTIDGWGFDMEILAIARKKGYTIGIIDVPDWKDIKEGSKISGSSPIKASLQTLGDLSRIKWHSIRGIYSK